MGQSQASRAISLDETASIQLRNAHAELQVYRTAVAQEQEALRLARAKIVEEDTARAANAEPRRQKTLKELEAAEASGFGKQPMPVMSLYAR